MPKHEQIQLKINNEKASILIISPDFSNPTSYSLEITCWSNLDNDFDILRRQLKYHINSALLKAPIKDFFILDVQYPEYFKHDRKQLICLKIDLHLYLNKAINITKNIEFKNQMEILSNNIINFISDKIDIQKHKK